MESTLNAVRPDGYADQDHTYRSSHWTAIGPSPMTSGKAFTDRLFGLRKRNPTGKHEFDQLCTDLGIEHRLAPPQHPQSETDQETVRGTVSPANGMAERFNGRIEEVLQSHHFRSGGDLETTLHRHALPYDQQLPQSAPRSRTPLQAMKDWHQPKPEPFKKQPYRLPGCDRYGHQNQVDSSPTRSTRCRD